MVSIQATYFPSGLISFLQSHTWSELGMIRFAHPTKMNHILMFRPLILVILSIDQALSRQLHMGCEGENGQYEETQLSSMI